MVLNKGTVVLTKLFQILRSLQFHIKFTFFQETDICRTKQ